MTIVVDHDTGRLVWAAAGRDKTTLRRFFDALGDDRCALITHVSADAADWIADVVSRTLPGRDPLRGPVPRGRVGHRGAGRRAAAGLERRAGVGAHRAESWPRPPRQRTPRRAPAHEQARKLKGARYALWKNPDDLTERQTEKLAWIAKTDTRLYRAYLLKEGLRHVFSVKGEAGKQALDRWISWARRCRIPVFVELARRIVNHRDTDRRRPRPRPVPRADRIHQHQDPATHPDRVRLPLRRGADRPGHARPRRPPARAPRPRLTPTHAQRRKPRDLTEGCPRPVGD